MAYHVFRPAALAPFLLLISSTALAGPEPQQEQGKPPAGDLGLEDIEKPSSAQSPRDSSKAGIGINAALSPSTLLGAQVNGPAFLAALLTTNFSLRLWLEHLMIEPILGLGLISGTSDANPTQFVLNAGVLAGYALKSGNLRPIIGGGFTFAIATQNETRGAITFGPMFGLEYRFNELPQLGFDAALLVPFHMVFNPFIFSFGTSGSVIIGFHYYFSS
jgi:hypothetical protein